MNRIVKISHLNSKNLIHKMMKLRLKTKKIIIEISSYKALIKNQESKIFH